MYTCVTRINIYSIHTYTFVYIHIRYGKPPHESNVYTRGGLFANSDSAVLVHTIERKLEKFMNLKTRPLRDEVSHALHTVAHRRTANGQVHLNVTNVVHVYHELYPNMDFCVWAPPHCHHGKVDSNVMNFIHIIHMCVRDAEAVVFVSLHRQWQNGF